MDMKPYLGKKRKKYESSYYSKLYDRHSDTRNYNHHKRETSYKSSSSNSYHNHYVLINI